MIQNRRILVKPDNGFNINEHFSILYVEDQLDTQGELAEILSLYVDQVELASNGQEGLIKYQELLPDIIITDIQMPIMSGLEMIQNIRQKDPDIPIIVTSAFNDSKYLLEAISMGVEYYLLKPISLDRLQAQLQRVKKRLLDKRELESYQIYLEDRIEEEIALGEAKEALLIEKNKSSEVGEMVSIIAHQWKQPLHYLNLLIEDLGMEYDYHPLSKEYINDFIKKGTDRVKFLSETMDNFLHFYKSESKMETFSTTIVTQEISKFLDMFFKALGIKINIQVHKDFSLYGIENEFQQVILNLMNNAKEAFDGQKKSDAKISIEISKRESTGVIIIEDNAGGIKGENINSIFDAEYTTKDHGNGIGLYLVKKIVEKSFNGEIRVHNNELGARFELIFNISKEKSNEHL